MATGKSHGAQEVTSLLLAWRRGDDLAFERLLPLVYHELHRIARRAMARERPDHTLQPTALVNEVYLRLVDLKSVPWNNRAHFFALSARLMRRILVDLARAKGYQKRGGGAPKASLEEAAAVPTMQPEDVIALDEALERLAAMDPRRSQVVELRFFGGLEIEAIAEVLQVSRHTVMRDWTLARTWLFRELKRQATH
jgi:RNA polymerase sigma factor (TIGR02999 family)